MAVFDALRHLSTYLNEAHTSGKHHLADLYEIVQYAGNILVVSPDRPRPSPRVELTLLPGGGARFPPASHLPSHSHVTSYRTSSQTTFTL